MRQIVTKKKDYIALDIVRGCSVFLMILSHSIAFFSDNSNLVLNFFRLIGDTFSFIVFLFISGSVAFISYHESGFVYKKSRIHRIYALLIIYYIIAFIPYIKDGIVSVISHLIPTLLFFNVPNFTEFMIPFIVFSFFSFKPEILKRITKGPSTIILISIICLFLSTALYGIDFGFLNPIKAVFVGSEGYYRFPLINYLSVFLFGAIFAKYYIHNSRKVARNGLLFMGTILLIVSLTYKFDFVRWPPNVPFLILGIFFTIFLISTYQFYNFKIIRFLGKNALLLVLFHLVIINIVDIFTYKTYNNIVVVFALFIAILLLSIFLTKSFNVIRKVDQKEKIFEST